MPTTRTTVRLAAKQTIMNNITKTQEIFELSAPYDNIYQGKTHRALFVCSAGLLRSATSATIGSQLGLNARAAGSKHYALVPVSVNLIAWAHTIYFVNEENYLDVKDTFFGDAETTTWLINKAVVWDIPDNYSYMQPELVEIVTNLLKF